MIITFQFLLIEEEDLNQVNLLETFLFGLVSTTHYYIIQNLLISF